MHRVMTDLETRGTVPGCAILSIGAVRFDPSSGELGDELYTVINRESCLVAGLHEDPDTMAWWLKQSKEARLVLEASEVSEVTLKAALEELTEFCQMRTNTLVYGNGADFDNPILAVAYRAVGLKQGWKPYNGRCYRTIKADYPLFKLVRQGTFHNALDDAKSQAVHLCKLAQLYELKLL